MRKFVQWQERRFLLRRHSRKGSHTQKKSGPINKNAGHIFFTIYKISRISNILCPHDKSRDASMSFFFISETSTLIHCKYRYIYIHTWVRKAGRKEKHFLVSDTQREKEKHCTIVFFQLLKKEKKSEQHISFGSYIRRWKMLRCGKVICFAGLSYYIIYYMFFIYSSPFVI
jgi:hypothetical protein